MRYFLRIDGWEDAIMHEGVPDLDELTQLLPMGRGYDLLDAVVLDDVSDFGNVPKVSGASGIRQL